MCSCPNCGNEGAPITIGACDDEIESWSLEVCKEKYKLLRSDYNNDVDCFIEEQKDEFRKNVKKAFIAFRQSLFTLPMTTIGRIVGKELGENVDYNLEVIDGWCLERALLGMARVDEFFEQYAPNDDEDDDDE